MQLDAKSGQAPAGSSVHSAPPEEPTSAPAPEISQGKADDLANAVEEVRSATIMMELSLDGRRFHYLSPVWEDVVGLDPVECLGQPIADMLHPSDADLFAEATNQLLSDSSHTVEVRFRLKVYLEAESNDDDESNESNDEQDRTSVWEAMEGKGMCIHSRDSGEPSHTM